MPIVRRTISKTKKPLRRIPKDDVQDEAKPAVKTPERLFDKTQLKLANFKYQPHKDYLGHIFRWGFASTFVTNKTSVLDVGCGQEMPFARALGGSSINTVPRSYVGVDLNKIPDPISRKWANVFSEFNYIESYRSLIKQFGLFDLIINFEVYEHMTHELGAKLLLAMRKSLAPEGILVFSTPVFCSSYGMAKNHINEVTKAVVEAELKKAGLKIIAQYGTFCNWRDVKKIATAEEVATYDKVNAFYGTEILGCFLSPKYPEASRNITHVCVRADNNAYAECELVDSIVKSN